MELVHETLTRQIIGAAIRVHRALGPGLLESVYESCLAHDLATKDLRVERQVPVAVSYLGLQLEAGFRADLLVEDLVIVELKSVARLEAIHEAQLLTYLRLSNKPVGLLINFSATRLTDAIVRRALTIPAPGLGPPPPYEQQ